MRLVCPSCAAGFEVNPSALEPNGRTVRCAACKTTWFAKAPSLVLAEAKPEPAAPMPWVSEEDRADHHARAAVAERNAAAISDDAELAQIEHSPSISPGAEEEAPRPKRKTVISGRSTAKAHARRMPLGSVAILLAAVLLLGLAGRQSVVRAAPELASLYATIGLPVNLRGLEFQNIRTKQEIQDGVTVLAIEGEVENIAQGAVELPRVRLAVLGDNGVELYSWTALLPRSILYPHERVPFKSRLASPPAASKEIMVRFLTRRDLMASTR
ncbi:MAG: MJ0042-type zinc finger domain-containing protein [Xanthobacteraceae bacterium]